MSKRITLPRVLLALIFVAAIGWFALRGLPDGRLHVWFLDVGQGDAILIQTPSGQQILIDGGPSPSALLDQLGEVLPFWDRSLDMVILTHPDDDHMAGLIPLFDRYQVGKALDSLLPDSWDGAAWLVTAEAAGVRREMVAPGMRLASGPTVLTVLSPLDCSKAAGNDLSVVLRLEYGQSTMLLTGDAEQEAEQTMLRGSMPLRADVLKVGHHGSNASTSPEFLAAVQPRLAVISVGAENRYGHPAPELLQRLQGIEVLRTDQRGRIELVSDGQGWTVRSER